MTKQSFLQATFVLIIAGMITRFLGFINRLVVARVMGEEGIGLYMMALPTLILVLTLTQIGLPIAIAKTVAEHVTENKHQEVRKIMTIAFVIISCLSILFICFMMIFIPWMSQYLYTDPRVAYPLLASIPVVPIIAFSSILKGYFQGKQNMIPQSHALIIEQVVRICFVAFFIRLLIPYGVEFAAAGAMFSMILGELCSLAYLVHTFKRKKTFAFRNGFFKQLSSVKETAYYLFSIALPTTGSRLIGSFTHFLEPILVAQSLAIAGVSATVATKLYGELVGYVIPLLFLPTFITQSLSIALIPTISESEAKNDRKAVHYRIHQALRISFISGAIATIIFMLFASPILQTIYGTSRATNFLQFMAPFYLLLYIQAPLQSALQALHLAKSAMFNSCIGAMIKLVTLYTLASSSHFQMMGVVISMCTTVILITLLHLHTLHKKIHFSISFRDLYKMIALFGITFLFGKYVARFTFIHHDLYNLLLTISLIFFVYVIFLFVFRFISREDLYFLPFVKK